MKNNNYRKLFIIVSFLIYLGCNKTGQAPTALRPQITLSVAPSSIVIGDSLIMNINMENFENLFATSFQILFDTTYVEFSTLYTDSLYYEIEDNIISGPVILLDDTLGVLNFAMFGNNTDGMSFFIKGKKSTLNNTILGTAVTWTELKFNELNLIQTDGTNISNLNSLISRGVDITVTN